MWRLRRVQPRTTTEAETRGAKQVSLRTVENRKPPGSSVPNIPEPLLIRCIDLWSINSLNQILREYGSHPETKINAAKFPGTWTDSNFPPHQIIAMIRLLSCLRRTNTFINVEICRSGHPCSAEVLCYNGVFFVTQLTFMEKNAAAVI